MRTEETIFKEHAQIWKEETKYSSITTRVIEHPSYQAIINMGVQAVPYILKEIQNGEVDYDWHYALVKLTSEDPVVAGRDTLAQINNDWLEWGKKKGLI